MQNKQIYCESIIDREGSNMVASFSIYIYIYLKAWEGIDDMSINEEK